MSQVTGAIASSALHMYTAPAMGILSRDAEYLANAAAGLAGVSALPAAEELTRLYHSGFFTGANGRTNFSAFMLQHGIDVANVRRPSAAGRERQLLWNGILNLRKPEYSVEFLRKLWRQAVAGDDASANSREEYLRLALSKLGFKDRDQQDWFLNDDVELPLPVLQLLYRLGLLQGEQDFRARARVIGVPDGEAAWYSKLRFTLPTPPMVMAALETHAWDREFVSFWGMDAPTNPKWTTWMERLGYNYSAGTAGFGTDAISNVGVGGGDADATAANDLTWSEIIWRTNLRMPTLGELAQFRHRFRGNPDDQTTWSDPQVKPITSRDMQRFMDANRVPTLMRQMYERLFYVVPSKREIHSFIGTDSTNPAEVAGWLMDGGMRPDIAQRQATIMFAEEAKRRAAPVIALRDQAWKEYVRGVEKAYSEGAIDRPTAEAGLLTNNVPADVVKVKLDTIELNAHTGVIQAVIARTRADWFAGRTDEIEARTRLGKAGIPDPRINVLVATWKAQRGQGHQLAGTEKVLKWYRKGYLSRGQVIQRLSNLDWAKPDMLLLLTDIEAEMKQDAAKVIASLEKGREAQVREAEATLRSMMGNVDKIVSHLRRIRPKGDVLKWYAEGRITEGEARQTLLMQGYDTEAVDNYLIDALDKKKGKKSTAKGANGATGHAAAK